MAMHPKCESKEAGMKSTVSALKESMPDITNLQKASIHIGLDWVGMGEVELLLNHAENGKSFANMPAKAGVYVNLKDSKAKGIHMSRLYLLATQAFEQGTLSLSDISSLLKNMVESQNGVSDKARICVDFQLPLKRKALVSDLEGLRHYPIRLEWDIDQSGNVNQVVDFKIVYSSTCPCSAALARQLIKNKWLHDFEGQESVNTGKVAEWLNQESSIVATPHAQRSIASIRVKLNEGESVQLIPLIDLVEKTLQTPVQTAVKREDEQEFARLNGSNLMFCEDASRKIYSALNNDNNIKDFWLRVEHLESLHSHNAVSEVSKFGIKI